MADEVTFTFSLNATKGAVNLARHFAVQLDINAAAPAAAPLSQIIGTTEEAIVLTDVATNGIMWAYNPDAANFVEIGDYQGATFYPVVRINAGECWPFRLSQAVTLYAKADTAPVTLEIVVIDD